jgi:cytochrome c oxidase subunit 2
MKTAGLRALPLAVAAAASGCGGRQRLQSVLDAAGPEAARIERLWWVFFWVGAVVFALVIAAVVFAVVRGRRRTESFVGEAADRLLVPAVAGASALTLLVLFLLVGATSAAGRALSRLDDTAAITINLTGRQWWWEAEYEDGTPSQRFTTANELHIPVGRPVIVKGTSGDVIHSFWVPNLHGKVDLIPGRTTSRWIQADQAGTYRGQCAEFCGLQHAHMALLVVAEPMDAFEAWRAAQRRPAREPEDDQQRLGRDVFLASPCVMCHAVRGTPAGGRVGPDLTHLRSRFTLAAGTVPNTRGYLAGWILDPHGIKPGNHMPPNGLSAAEIQALLAWLDNLH